MAQQQARKKRVGQLKAKDEKKIKLVFIPCSPTSELKPKVIKQDLLRKDSTPSSPTTSHSSNSIKNSNKIEKKWQQLTSNNSREIMMPAKAKVNYSNRMRRVESISDEETVDQGFSSEDDKVEQASHIKVKNIHSLCEQGLSKLYKDELIYIQDGLKDPKMNIKRCSMMDILKKSNNQEFLNACRMHGVTDLIDYHEFENDAVIIFNRSLELCINI